MRSWKTELHLTSGEGQTRSSATCHKTYKIRDIKDIINPIRRDEVKRGLPRRKLNPVASYLIDVLIDKFLTERSKHGETLEKIVIKDTKHDL